MSIKKCDFQHFDDIERRLKNELKVNNSKQLVDFIGIPYATYRSRKMRGNFSAEWAVLLSLNYNYHVRWILLGEGPKKINAAGEEQKLKKKHNDSNQTSLLSNPSSCEENGIEYIPMSNALLSAGGGAYLDSDSIRDYYAFKKDWLIRTVTSVKNAVLVGVVGNSMRPTIYNGDVVLLDSGRTNIYDGNIYALRLDGTIMIKRLALRPNDKVQVVSDNRAEHDSYTANRREIHIIGRIVWYAHSLIRE